MTSPRIRYSGWRKRERRVFAADVCACVSRVFSIELSALKSNSRERRVARARQAAMRLIYELSAMTFPQIGHALGGRDHSTIVYGVDRCAELMRHDADYALKVRTARRLALRVKPLTAAGWQPGQIILWKRAERFVTPNRWRTRKSKQPPQRLAEPVTVNDGPEWWELSDDQLISRNIAEFKAKGGSFVEVYA